MLPNIRVVLGAIVAAVVLLAMSFALVATFRVAQDTRIGVLQADLAQRGRSFIPASEESRLGLPADKPAALEANPVAAVEIQEAPEITKEAPETPMAVALAVAQGEPPATDLPVAELPATEIAAVKPPSAEPPVGGPLVRTLDQAGPPAPRAMEIAAKRAKKRAEQAAAKKARVQRLARERKAAARKARAAQTRAQRQQSVSSFDNAPPGNSFGTFNNANSPLPNGTFGSSASGR
jgi:membrane protein involved in colicin uptake